MVSMGNPHAIIFVDDLEKDIDFESDGPALESDTSVFPAKTNVEFVQVMSPTHLKMKVSSSFQPNVSIPISTYPNVFILCFISRLRCGSVELGQPWHAVQVPAPWLLLPFGRGRSLGQARKVCG